MTDEEELEVWECPQCGEYLEMAPEDRAAVCPECGEQWSE